MAIDPVMAGRLLDLIQTKLRRRRHLNRPDIRKARAVISVPVHSIALTFAQAEAVADVLRSVAEDGPSPAPQETDRA